MQFSVEVKYHWGLTEEEDDVLHRAIRNYLDTTPTDAQTERVLSQLLATRFGAPVQSVLTETQHAQAMRNVEIEIPDQIVTAADLRRPTGPVEKTDLSKLPEDVRARMLKEAAALQGLSNVPVATHEGADK